MQTPKPNKLMIFTSLAYKFNSSFQLSDTFADVSSRPPPALPAISLPWARSSESASSPGDLGLAWTPLLEKQQVLD